MSDNLKNERLPRDSKGSTAGKRTEVSPRPASSEAENDKKAIVPAGDRSMQKKAPEALGSPKDVASAKIEQPLRDSDSAPRADGEEASLAVTKVLSVLKPAAAISATSKDSGEENSSSAMKVSIPNTGPDTGVQEGREDATRILDVKSLATASSTESQDAAASEENKVSESPSTETGGSQAATPFTPKEEIRKGDTSMQPGRPSTNDPAVVAFEEPQMADDGDRTRFFQRPVLTEPADHAQNSSSQKALPFTNGPSEPASLRNVGPSPGEAQRNKENVAASPHHVAPVPRLVESSGKATGDFSAMASTNLSNSTSNFLVPLVLILNLCTAALGIVVTVLLVNTPGGLPHVFSLFRR
jgi:hypothetical protein